MTQLCYFRNWTNLKASAKVASVILEEDKKVKLTFDRTPFYPQGGGQPSDQGYLRCPGCSVTISKVTHSPEGSVDHCGILNDGALSIGDSVDLEVDSLLRQWHCRLHSAGHVIDGALANLKISLKPGKAYHFEDGPYVEYDGIVDGLSKEELMRNIEDACNDLIVQNLPVHIDFANEDINDQTCLRSMRIADLISIPCGGTHVSFLGEIGEMKIRKIDVKKGKTRVCYSITK